MPSFAELAAEAARAFAASKPGAPAGLQLQWQGIDVATGAVNTYANTLLLSDRNVVPGADGGWDRVGDLLIFDVDSDDQVLEHQVRVRAALADAAGAPLAEVEATVTVVCCG